jgi:predicted O-methyltransferase YrrM
MNTYDKLIKLYKDKNFTIKEHGSVYMTPIELPNIGGSITKKEISYFEKYKNQFNSPKIFIIGNAFGFSTFAFNYIFKNASIDVIDAECEGNDNQAGSRITNEIIKENGFDINLTIGYSPQDVNSATRFEKYDIVFIDGYHSNEQVLKDFYGIKPYLKTDWICFMHDVRLTSLQSSMHDIIKNEQNIITDSILELPETLSESGIGILTNNIPILT